MFCSRSRGFSGLSGLSGLRVLIFSPRRNATFTRGNLEGIGDCQVSSRLLQS